MPDPPKRPPLQFGLRSLLAAMVAIGTVLMLAMLPEPANVYVVYMIGAVGGGLAFSRSIWQATIAGGVCGTAGIYLVEAIRLLQRRPGWSDEFHLMTFICCIPYGAAFGLLVGLIAQESRRKQLLKAKMAELDEQLGKNADKPFAQSGEPEEPRSTPD